MLVARGAAYLIGSTKREAKGDTMAEKAFRVYATRTTDISGIVYADTEEEAHALAEEGEIEWTDIHDTNEEIDEVEEIRALSRS